MRYYIYKCNSRGPDYAPEYGDWNRVFEQDRPTPWGRVTAHPEFESLRAGDRLIAQQSNRNELVGVAEVVALRGRGHDRRLVVRPLERLGVKIRPLKQADPRIATIPALQGGPIQTLYDITTSDAKYYLRAARAAIHSKPGNRSSYGRGGRHAATSPRRRILFARIGWMTFYAGSQPGDERPVGGGSYNLDNHGHERFNFSNVDGRLYGCFQPPGSGPNLARIEPGWTQDRLEDVLIVFVAANRVVGWYEGATLYANAQLSKRLRKQRDGCSYFCEADAAHAVLLPTAQRILRVPKGRDGMGQANVGYIFDAFGKPRRGSWISKTISWIRSYSGPNLLTDPMAEAEDEVTRLIEETVAAARGQGFNSSAAARRAIEDRAMAAATRHFKKEGYQVEVRGKPFDLLCKRGSETLYVEVKGTQGDSGTVMLTPGEVKFARRNRQQMVLFLLYALKVTERGGHAKASGGRVRILRPWSIGAGMLTPITYWYTLPTSS